MIASRVAAMFDNLVIFIFKMIMFILYKIKKTMRCKKDEC